jgi:hypothetical protein
LICCLSTRISASSATRDRNRSLAIAKINRHKSSIECQHRAILSQLPARLNLRQGQEAECFNKREFIRMNESTSTKVHFFKHVIDLALRGKLKTAGQSIANRIDKLLESRTSRVLALTGTLLGLLSWIVWLAIKGIQ